MSGFDVTLKHRFGGHGGFPTEWEITVDNEHAKKMIRGLPKFLYAQHTRRGKKHDNYAFNWIDLPEGTSALVAGKVAAALAELDRDALVKALADCDRQVRKLYGKRRPEP